MRTIAKATVARKADDYGQYPVKAYDQDGKRWPECDYFPTDREDAKQTAKAMVDNGRILASIAIYDVLEIMYTEGSGTLNEWLDYCTIKDESDIRLAVSIVQGTYLPDNWPAGFNTDSLRFRITGQGRVKLGPN